jgi:hypothetical protein
MKYRVKSFLWIVMVLFGRNLIAQISTVLPYDTVSKQITKLIKKLLYLVQYKYTKDETRVVH